MGMKKVVRVHLWQLRCYLFFLIMETFWKVWEKDITGDGFTVGECVFFGVIAPLVMVGIIGLVGWMESLV